MYRITAPVEDYAGKVGDVQFANGKAETDDPAVVAYCQSAGYTVERVDQVDEPGAGEGEQAGAGEGEGAGEQAEAKAPAAKATKAAAK